MNMEDFLKRWYKYARLEKIKATNPKRRAWFSEQLIYIESVWKELKKEVANGV